MKTSSLFIISALLLLSFTVGAQTQVMTYNIKYANENDGENSWSKRKDWITSQIAFYEADVLGVQEAVKSQLEYFLEELDQYAVIGEARDGRDKGEFSALLYKKDKFEVLNEDTFWLSETPSEVSRGWDADFNRVCTYALFENKETGEQFWVFNTHFDHVGTKARSESSKLIISKIKELNQDNLPVLLMGDFNLEPDTKEIRMISEFLSDSKMKADLTFGPEGTYNGYNFSQAVNRRIDYIFSNEKVMVNKYAVLSDSKDLRYPSDHLPVMVEVEFSEE
ncbi:endonuclease/exonuclease/phosphatase family protein [Gramella sp. GC03-9]|uniref:Endonuclease/exonuclease/phosphatase family protein n=1 Tax=Christiangramia oceanisediminis TaxID=2920386 RepID=A0A9X2KZV4_9FLAO|nr:endonuclease/exonuclease/phosphatase family protein [Gramella oceanisediminis]MCP9201256.1 endonuclease/exonuclease/phosphatase family protein [Gramella oceanisediminis]